MYIVQTSLFASMQTSRRNAGRVNAKAAILRELTLIRFLSPSQTFETWRNVWHHYVHPAHQPNKLPVQTAMGMKTE